MAALLVYDIRILEGSLPTTHTGIHPVRKLTCNRLGQGSLWPQEEHKRGVNVGYAGCLISLLQARQNSHISSLYRDMSLPNADDLGTRLD